MTTHYNEPDENQHVPTFTDLFFDEHSRPVPVVEPEVYAEPDEMGPGLDPEQLLTILLTGSASSQVSGDRALLLGYVRREKVPTAPQSLRELARRLGCSHVAASKRVNKLRADIRREYAHFATRRVNKAPVHDEH